MAQQPEKGTTEYKAYMKNKIKSALGAVPATVTPQEMQDGSINAKVSYGYQNSNSKNKQRSKAQNLTEDLAYTQEYSQTTKDEQWNALSEEEKLDRLNVDAAWNDLKQKAREAGYGDNWLQFKKDAERLEQIQNMRDAASSIGVFNWNAPGSPMGLPYEKPFKNSDLKRRSY